MYSVGLHLIKCIRYSMFIFSVHIGLFCSTPAVAVGRAIPRKVAMEMLYTGEPISAQGTWTYMSHDPNLD